MQKEQQVQRSSGQNNISKLESKKQGRRKYQEMEEKAETRSQDAWDTTEKDKFQSKCIQFFFKADKWYSVCFLKITVP